MTNFFSYLLNSILPPRCIKCGRIIGDDSGLCAECFNEINFISAPYCQKCGHPFEVNPSGKKMLCGKCMQKNKTPFRLCRSAVHYDEASKNIILAFKFMDRTDNAKTLAKWLNLAGKDIWEQGVDLMMPIPLHFTRLLKRRYNQCSLLTAELSKITGIQANYQCLVKHRKTRPQVEFSGHERIKNLKGAFSVKHQEQIQGKRIVLIDDVMTTGSTLKECASVLKKAGAKSVDALTVARVI